MSRIKCICGEQLGYLATTIAITLAKEFDRDDINILSSFFNAIGDNLGIIAAQRAACEPDSGTKTTTKDNLYKK